MRIRSLAAILATATLLGCTSEETSGDHPVWARGPVIEAQGRAYVELAPNRAAFSVSFEDRSPESEAASAAAVARANQATEAIRRATEGDVRITANLNVRPYYSQVLRRYGEHNEQLVENIHPDALLGYVATVSVNVVVLDPKRAAKARGAALAAGPVNSSPMRIYLEPTAESQRIVYAAAVRDATERAALIAEASGARLGKLQVLQEGQGPCLGSPSTDTGYAVTPRSVRETASVSAPAPERDTSAKAIVEAAEHFELAADLQPQRIEARVCAVYAVR